MNLMALIRMFTIRFRMEGAIGVVLLLLGLLGGVGMWSMLRIYDLHQDFIQVPWQQSQQLQQMQSKLDALQLKEKEVLITFSRSANLDDSYSQWKADVQAVQGQMQQIGQTMEASQKTHLEKLGQSVQAYVDGFGPLVQSLQANPYVSVEETLEAANVPYQHLLAAQQALGALQMQLQEQAHAFEAKGASVKDEAQWLFLAAVLLTLLVVGPLTWMNMLAICRPLAQAQKLAKAIATGDLTQSIDSTGKDEVADLQRDLQAMQSNLAQLVGQVQLASNSIAIASQEIASGNTDLSSRTEQTASNLQQTVASLEELTSTVHQTADAAGQARPTNWPQWLRKQLGRAGRWCKGRWPACKRLPIPAAALPTSLA